MLIQMPYRSHVEMSAILGENIRRKVGFGAVVWKNRCLRHEHRQDNGERDQAAGLCFGQTYNFGRARCRWDLT